MNVTRDTNGYPFVRFSEGSNPKITEFGTPKKFHLIIKTGTETLFWFRFVIGFEIETYMVPTRGTKSETILN